LYKEEIYKEIGTISGISPPIITAGNEIETIQVWVLVISYKNQSAPENTIKLVARIAIKSRRVDVLPINTPNKFLKKLV